MSVSTEQASASYSPLPEEQPSGTHRAKADSFSSESTANWINEDCDSSDDESPGRLHRSKPDYKFEV